MVSLSRSPSPPPRTSSLLLRCFLLSVAVASRARASMYVFIDVTRDSRTQLTARKHRMHRGCSGVFRRRLSVASRVSAPSAAPRLPVTLILACSRGGDYSARGITRERRRRDPLRSDSIIVERCSIRARRRQRSSPLSRRESYVSHSALRVTRVLIYATARLGQASRNYSNRKYRLAAGEKSAIPSLGAVPFGEARASREGLHGREGCSPSFSLSRFSPLSSLSLSLQPARSHNGRAISIRRQVETMQTRERFNGGLGPTVLPPSFSLSLVLCLPILVPPQLFSPSLPLLPLLPSHSA